ncbi:MULTISPECIES: UDP-N-acetylmuramate--L-alanine ligase [Croceibacter]|jgi:UDP-N-acetylmuramate: L-alanyl-gamma-D-glutamyl-meso-diaminopimelate ligase|uniref:L-alanyl-gamma-D-glutamyl-meso-diaminopimelate ligase n=1 Tax=Croceibacter atlanticus (strain ATCC BAA-628 / JCM 21780 / CIP 108009 / IAM 15332 / KCTC 12090 / HTCC2559) TaxID=216432 RepID=A3U7J1_CROAH|nr:MULTISPECIES: Mur ligase family protein [Croceibacter]EAP88208.1 L-alanyl-gamma-D-glutamyl-meso-diaminopimelate ligase [Croceibacter atlanticus HTCC2559]MBG25129.1 peptidoglycan synthetase [Croceibacter sp.]MBW4969651.1 peptidoglycan synthetase [Croceibacter atlanticus]|tara:strand:- start:5748 stop:7100 length:1353 start_codon:yes stop_codon:yes gene_type:complete
MNIHFIAIGGSAMHNLALALHHKGYKVTGSDDTIFEPSKSRLSKHNLLPETFGWFPERITNSLDAVILGMHAKADNPELLKAKELGLKIYSYPEFLYEQSKQKTRVVIGGSHGKTTITAMILHVMNYHDKEVDYMVGAQLEGFDTMVHLTEENDFIVLEGDEYLSSPIDRRPKFHLYKPNIALLSGIAWDHINVFPTFENYVEQFKIFADSMSRGGILVYNEEDPTVKQVAEEATAPTRKHAYTTAAYSVENGKTLLETPEGPMPIEIFGAHNLNNLAGAKWICQHMGVDEDEFYEAISTFKGASKRLEKITENNNAVVYKDYAHSPSKVSATTKAVKNQYPDRKLVACLELHTYSSLNAEFLDQYEGALDAADKAIVFYSPDAVQIKQLDEVKAEQINEAFKRDDLVIFTNPADFKTYLYAQDFKDSVLLLMSSGNYGGLDFNELKSVI